MCFVGSNWSLNRVGTFEVQRLFRLSFNIFEVQRLSRLRYKVRNKIHIAKMVLNSTSKRVSIEGRVEKSNVVEYPDDGGQSKLLDVIIVCRDGNRVSMSFYNEAFQTAESIEVGRSYRFAGGYGKIRTPYSLSTIGVDVGFSRHCRIEPLVATPVENEVAVGTLADLDLREASCLYYMLLFVCLFRMRMMLLSFARMCLERTVIPFTVLTVFVWLLLFCKTCVFIAVWTDVVLKVY